MKRFEILKTIQLILYLCLAAAGLLMLLSDSELFRLMADDERFHMLGVLLWLLFGLSFLFIFVDFSLLSSFRKDYRELDFAVTVDPVSGIANRYSCDALIEHYLDHPLPPGTGCIMLDLTSLNEINHSCGHTAGNELIRDFAGILKTASEDMCFVGRNGGSRFLIFFEKCSADEFRMFSDRVEDGVRRHNEKPDSHFISCALGSAFEDHDKTGSVTELISLASSRISGEKDAWRD